MNYKTIAVGAAMTVATVVFTALSTLDPEKVADWKAWAVGVAVASIRQVSIYFLQFTKREAV